MHTPSSSLCQVQTGTDDNDNSQIKHLYLNLASDSESGPPESRYDHCRLQLSTESSISTAAKRSYQRERLRLSSSIPGLPPVGVGRRRPPPPGTLAEAADGEPVHDAASWNVCAHGTVLSASPATQPSRHTAQQVSSPAPPAVTVVSGTGSLATALAAAGMPPNRPLANPAARTRQGRPDAAMAVSRRWHGEDEHRILWMRSVSKLAPAAAAHRARRRHARPSRSRRGDGDVK